MCELFAMSADQPTQVGKYLSLLMPRGGNTGPHADGWGVSYYQGRAAQIFKDPRPAAESCLLAMLADQELKSTNVIAHIRKANPSRFGRATANTHPFEREWGGRSWVFAHNGKLPGLNHLGVCPVSRFTPIGETDSELAFCLIMNAMSHCVQHGVNLSPLERVLAIKPVIREVASFGEFNFILSDGEHLYVHCHTRLHRFKQVIETDLGRQQMHLLATEPLNDDPWQALNPGGIYVFRKGYLIFQDDISADSINCLDRRYIDSRQYVA